MLQENKNLSIKFEIIISSAKKKLPIIAAIKYLLKFKCSFFM